MRRPHRHVRIVPILLNRIVPILLKKSFGGGERKFLEPLMRFVRSDVRDHVASPKIDR